MSVNQPGNGSALDGERQSRRQFSPQEKAAILRRHLIEKVPVSQLCEELGIQPTLFYRWQQQLFENAPLALGRQNARADKAEARRIADLEERLSQKNEVLSELLEEHVRLKKTLGVR